jgi:sulfur carrier protein
LTLIINGGEVEVPDDCNDVNALLRHFQLDEKIVIVEWNAQILDKAQHATTCLADGDRIEIVHFVGGG